MGIGLANGVQLDRVHAACGEVHGIRGILGKHGYTRNMKERRADEGQKYATDGLLKAKGCTGEDVGKHTSYFFFEKVGETPGQSNFAPRKVNLRQ